MGVEWPELLWETETFEVTGELYIESSGVATESDAVTSIWLY